MLLFKKKDLLVIISKSDNTVQFTKPLKDILKYQYRYNYKFKLYENGKVTTADDYIIDGETLTVLFGSAVVTYTSEGATYTEGSGGDGGGSGTQNDFMTVVILRNADGTYSSNKTYDEILSHFDEDEYVLDIPIICIYCDRVRSIFMDVSFDGIGDSDDLYFFSTTVNLGNTINKTLNVQNRVFIMDSSNNITLGTDTTVTGNLN